MSNVCSKRISSQHLKSSNTLAKVKGKFEIDTSKIKGNAIEDIFDLSPESEKIKESLFGTKKTVKISINSYVSLPSCMQIFKFCLWFGYSKAPVIKIMPKKYMREQERWVRNNFSDYPRMTEEVMSYICSVGKGTPYPRFLRSYSAGRRTGG